MGKYNHKNDIILSGKHIYKDKKNKYVYYDTFTKLGYAIQNNDKYKILLYKNRLIISLFVGLLGYGTIFPVWVSCILAVAVFVIIEMYMRLSFFKRLPTKNIEKYQNVSTIQVIQENKSQNKIIILAILYSLFALLIVINAYIENYSMGINLLSVEFGCIGLYLAFLHIMALKKA